MQCLNCNHKNKENMSFCENCGEPLIVSKENNNEAIDEKMQIHNKNAKSSPKKSHKKLLIVIACILVLLGGSIGFLTVSGIGGQVISNLTADTFLESEKSKIIERQYQEGISLMDLEKYEDAFAAFAKIPKTHYRYNDAKKKAEICSQHYAKSIIAELKEYKTNKDYEKAYELLSGANEKALKDNLSLDEEILQLQKDYRDYLLSQAKEYKDDGDYAGALEVLAGCNTKILPDDKEINSETKILQDGYRQIALTNAEAILESEGYNTAIKYLQGGFDVLPNDSVIKEKIAEYAQYQPVALYDLEYFSASSDYACSKEDSYKTNDGVEHINGLSMKPTRSLNGEEPWVEYKIDGGYTSFTGTLAIDYNHRTSDAKVIIKIYGDDVLLYTSPTLTKGVDPEPYNVNISGVSKLKLECVVTNDYYYGGKPLIFFVDSCLNV